VFCFCYLFFVSCVLHLFLALVLKFVIRLYSTTNKTRILSQIIYSCKTLYMFRAVFPPIIRSSKLRIQQRFMSNSWFRGWVPPIAAGSSSCLTYTVAVYAVLSSYWWAERPPETCREFYKNKWFEIRGASCWLYYRNMLRCTDIWILDRMKIFKLINFQT
jgi:hypothetical protein